MKSFVLALLAASVSAEANVACKAIEGNAGTAVAEATDAATCGTKGTAEVEAASDKADNDWCLAAVTTAAVEASAEGVEPVVAARDAAFSCTLFKVAKSDDVELREAKEAADGISYDAWQWAAGEQSAEFAPAAEGDADSAKMITSALAAVATIAMVAY